MTIFSAEDRARFERDGYVRVPDAFSADAAAEMRDVVWRRLERRGIRRDDPSTWVDEAPSHLQPLKSAAPFRAIGTPRTLAAIAEVLDGEFRAPKDWGAFFILFPTPRPWSVPHRSWHVDHNWTRQLRPLSELKIHSVFGDIEARAGGMTIVAGSHHVVAHVVGTKPPRAGARQHEIRDMVMHSHPYLRDLGNPRDPMSCDERIARFTGQSEDVFGHEVRVVELTACAGDVILIDPLVLHTRPTNAGTQPRFLLNKDLYVAGTT
jgi:hypothetical protein